MHRWIVLFSCVSTSAFADSLSFVEGDGGAYSTTEDTVLIASEGWSETNLSGEASLTIDQEDGSYGYGETSALIRFPDAFGQSEGQIPKEAEIVSAWLHLYISNPGGLVQAYEVLEDWVEDEVTWESRSDDLGPWQVAGAAAHPSHATKVLDEFEGIEGDWVTLSIDSAVEFWAQRPDENFGVLLQAQSDDGTDIPSSEAMDATLRPMMTVVFLLPDDWEPDDEEEKPDDDDDEPKDEEEPQDDTGSTMGDTASADSGEKGVDSELDSGNSNQDDGLSSPNGDLVSSSCGCAARLSPIGLSAWLSLVGFALIRRRSDP